ncbi:MAG: nickel transporter permease [Egibacteraceae bacterium]
MRDPLVAAALCVVVLSLLAAVAAPLLAPHDPSGQQLEFAFSPPSARFPLGADHLGRDVLSRLLYGARATLFSAGLVLLLTVTIAGLVGLVAGFYGGWIDALLMRLVDLLLAFPSLLLAVAIAGTLGQSLRNVVFALTVVGWAGYARILRGLVLACREQEYVLAAKALGAPARRLMTRHILRNTVGPVIVLASLDVGTIILSIAGLNFLGLGVQPPGAEWGAMLHAAQPYLQTDPLLVLVPGAAIFVVVLSCNLLGDGLRDALDPTARPA